ncbi:ABC transporter substrate-binding protein [Thalassotalea sp. LPB0316]|uniref:ABC transporter substrate-binding protein n=1 Tax=Thalassotalea sp. LPB0316 TaxID=2769490 RepID=UPI0018663A67|nr:ABC transporter substrate-binding protein [Thalassotalea sp. LPB0316]QOL27137.1 ABC transporter substrate-binding protein [Thalassotalea sp. LPB0316]
MKKTKQLFTLQRYFAGLVSAMTLLMAGCSNDEDVSLREKSIIYCSEGSPESFNPQTVTSGTTIDAIANQLYNRLITFNSEDNSIIPAIAKSWHVTRDGKKVTFYLRKDIRFHHTDYFTPTRNLNADDVLFSFNRILDPKNPYHQVVSGNFPYFQNVNFTGLVENIEKINDYTVRISLNYPDASFLAHLASTYSVILSKEYADQLSRTGDEKLIDQLPIGTGPYKFKEYRTGSLIRYYQHEHYWQKTNNATQVVFDITTNNSGRLAKLLAGECDIVAYPIAHKKIQEFPDVMLESVTALNVAYLGFNTAKPPFNDKKVRQAVAHAVNKQAIIDAVYFGRAEQAKSVLPQSSWAYDKTLTEHEYDPALARALLIDAGYPDGLTIDVWAMPVQRAYNPDALTMAKLIQSDLQQIGITVNIVSYEWVTFLRKLSRGEHQSVLLGWSADHPDPDNFFSPLLSCASAETGSNRAFWCNQAFDEILSEALSTTNPNQRKAFYRQAMAIVKDEIPLLPIAHSKRYQAKANYITGKSLDAFGGVNLSRVNKQIVGEQ